GGLVLTDGRALEAARAVEGMAEVSEQLLDALAGAALAFDLAVPAAFGGVDGERFLDLAAGAEPGRVLGRGDELSAGQVEVTLARPSAAPDHELELRPRRRPRESLLK